MRTPVQRMPCEVGLLIQLFKILPDVSIADTTRLRRTAEDAVTDRRKIRTIGAIRVKRRFGNPLRFCGDFVIVGNTSRFR
jgi:hypothetical protein